MALQTTILPTVTTLQGADWRAKIKEVQELGLKQIALFLTGLKGDERRECVEMLKQIPNLDIPVVHARSDMSLDEYKYLMNTFGTTMFNLHALKFYPLNVDLSEIQDKIYIENSGELQKEDVEGFAGLCIDLSHLENCRKTGQKCFDETLKLLDNFKVGFNHASAIYNDKYHDEERNCGYDDHRMTDISQFGYIKALPLKTSPIKEPIIGGTKMGRVRLLI